MTCRSSSRSRTMIGYSLPPWRNIAACVPATLVRIVLATRRGADAEQRGLGAIDAHRQLRAAFVAAEAGVGDARHRVEQVLGGLGDAAATSTMSSPRISSDSRPPPPPPLPPPERKRFIWLLPPDALARTITPGMPGELPAQIDRDLLARARPLVLRRQEQLDEAAVAAAAAARAAGSEAAAARPAFTIMSVASGTSSPDHLLDPRRAPASVTSMRVPWASSTFTCTWPSSVCVENSVGSVGKISAAADDRRRRSGRPRSAGARAPGGGSAVAVVHRLRASRSLNA